MANQRTYEMYEGWLKEVDILKALNSYELTRLSLCLVAEYFDANEVIIQQGATGEKLYILEGGSCIASIKGPEGKRDVKTYIKRGDYFGELALITNSPHKATVQATVEGTSVLALSKTDFIKLLGPLRDILAKNIDKYPRYSQVLLESS